MADEEPHLDVGVSRLRNREHPQVATGDDTDELLTAFGRVGHRVRVRSATVPCCGERLTVGAALPQLLAGLRIKRAAASIIGCALFMRPRMLFRAAIVLKPSTLLRFHRALTTRKYRQLFSSMGQKNPGPKGPSREMLAAVVDMKQRNPTWRCPRIAQQITLAFDIPMNKDVVRRILARRYTPKPDGAGPSWLTVLGHPKDSLWSVDLFRCESAILRAYWVLVVMDQCTRRIVCFGVHPGAVDGVGLCRMFNHAIRGEAPPKYLSSDHDRLFQFHQWQANLRILDIEEIKTVPYAPLSHPFVERVIGTIRRECLDRTLFWTGADLEMKLAEFQRYYNEHRAHAGLAGQPCAREKSGSGSPCLGPARRDRARALHPSSHPSVVELVSGTGENSDVVAYDAALADRIRALLAGSPGLTEKKMFGGLAFLVRGNMAVAASGQGGLLVRVDPAHTKKLVNTTSARVMVMRGRSMPGWLRVSADDVGTKQALARWVELSSSYAGSLPAKKKA